MNQEAEAPVGTDQVKPVQLWAVTRGSYSDFDVVALFADEADARDAEQTGLGEDVRPYWLYPKGAQPPQRAMVYTATATLDPGVNANRPVSVNGSVEVHEELVWALPDTHLSDRPEVSVYSRNGGGFTFQARRCLSREAATKAVSDRVAKLKAEWLEAPVST